MSDETALDDDRCPQHDVSNEELTARIKEMRIFVMRMARYWLPRSGAAIGFDDLVSEGNLGVREAARRFDEARGVKFFTYAQHWVTHAMRRHVQDMGAMIRVPSHLIDRRGAILRGAGEAQDFKTANRVARLVGDDMLRDLCGPARAWRKGDTPLILADTLADDAQPLPDAAVESSDNRALLRRLLATLEPRARRVLLQRAEGRLLDEIATELDLSRERVRQIEVRSIARLKERLQRWMAEEDRRAPKRLTTAVRISKPTPAERPVSPIERSRRARGARRALPPPRHAAKNG